MGAAAPGARVAASAQLNSAITLVTSYSYSGSLQAIAELADASDLAQLRSALRQSRNHSFAIKVDSALPRTRTHVLASYRWMPAGAVTMTDPYNRGIGQADPYLSVYVLQPIPSPDILPGQFAAIADFSNLLAQGYIPFRGANGLTGTLYPAARIFRGGFNFTF